MRKAAIFLVLLSLPVLINTRSISSPQAGGNPSSIVEARGAFLGLSVPDVQASASWYSEKLGLQVIFQPPPSGPSTVIVLEGGGLIVELLQDNRAVPLSQAAPSISANYLVHGIFKAGVVVKQYDKLVTALQERGIPIALGPFPETAEQPANLLIRDNAGNLIQFISDSKIGG